MKPKRKVRKPGPLMRFDRTAAKIQGSEVWIYPMVTDRTHTARCLARWLIRASEYLSQQEKR